MRAGSDPDTYDTPTYRRSQTSGELLTLSAATTARASFIAPSGLSADAELVSLLTAADGGGLSHSDSVTVTVAGPTLTKDPPTLADPVTVAQSVSEPVDADAPAEEGRPRRSRSTIPPMAWCRPARGGGMSTSTRPS